MRACVKLSYVKFTFCARLLQFAPVYRSLVRACSLRSRELKRGIPGIGRRSSEVENLVICRDFSALRGASRLISGLRHSSQRWRGRTRNATPRTHAHPAAPAGTPRWSRRPATGERRVGVRGTATAARICAVYICYALLFAILKSDYLNRHRNAQEATPCARRQRHAPRTSRTYVQPELSETESLYPVSYTHLTLPTIHLV